MAMKWLEPIWIAALIAVSLANPATAGPPSSGVAIMQPPSEATGGVRSLIDGGALEVIEGTPVVRLGPDPGLDMAAGDPLTCLAQAVYFEARSESVEGQEAVAQVVMNRTHLADRPPTVCGVVFEGQERGIGCQFTFACDGSLGEPGDMAAWNRALAVAKQALGGFVYKPMREATHYHAAWMTPYWAAQRTRIRQIGGHIFYR